MGFFCSYPAIQSVISSRIEADFCDTIVAISFQEKTQKWQIQKSFSRNLKRYMYFLQTFTHMKQFLMNFLFFLIGSIFTGTVQIISDFDPDAAASYLSPSLAVKPLRIHAVIQGLEDSWGSETCWSFAINANVEFKRQGRTICDRFVVQKTHHMSALKWLTTAYSRLSRK